TMPAGNPSSRAKPTANVVSSMVTGSRSRMSATTGLPVRHEVPRSPRTSPPIQRPYCTHHGWSSPKNRLSSATIAGLTMASAPIIPPPTPPGPSRNIKNTNTDNPTNVSTIEYSRTTTYLVIDAEETPRIEVLDWPMRPPRRMARGAGRGTGPPSPGATIRWRAVVAVASAEPGERAIGDATHLGQSPLGARG